MNLFGPSKQDVWRELCRQIGAEYVDGGFWHGDKVTALVEPWTVTLDTYTASQGETSTTYTRIRAPYVNRDGFRFTLHRSSVFTGLGKMLGIQDIEVGDAEFDLAFVVQGNSEARTRALFADPRLRELLASQRSITLKVIDDEGIFGPRFDEHVDELYFETAAVIRDIERLKILFDLFAETLHQLCVIGSAYEVDPGLPVSLPVADTLLRGTEAPTNNASLLRPSTEAADKHSSELPRPVDEPG